MHGSFVLLHLVLRPLLCTSRHPEREEMRAHALPGWLLSTCSIATTSRRSTTTTTTLVLNRCYCARQMSSVASTSGTLLWGATTATRTDGSLADRILLLCLPCLASTNSSQAEHPPQQSDPRRPSRSPAGEKKPPQRLDLGGGSSSSYPIDDYTNVTPTIASKIGRNIHLEPNHPIGILRKMIESHFSTFEAINALSPIVTVEKNFDELGFAADHPGRNLTDSYYINRKHMLRTHTSAHEVETFKRQSLDRWLLTADVYRRDEIDASHYPVFHQMEGSHVVDKGDATRVFEASNQELERKLSNANIRIVDETRINDSNSYQMEHDPVQAEIVARNLKNNLNSLVLDLFGPVAASRGNTTGSSGGSAAAAATSSSNEPLQVRWIEAFFPWTSPSYEVEVFFEGKWLEILGCGVVRQKTLDTAGEQ